MSQDGVVCGWEEGRGPVGDWFDRHGLRDVHNPMWPLPSDYAELTPTGQREARLSVLRDQSTPERLVVAWDFFRRVYLARSRHAIFYKRGFQESPDFHYDMIHDLGRYGRNAYAAPRGFAKSVLISTEAVLLLTLTRPGFDVMLGLATDSLVETALTRLKDQYESNELIYNDFGTVRKTRGKGLWSFHYLSLINGSTVNGISVMGKKRGGRPALFILDDPENDPASETESSRLILMEKFETILFKQILPMLEDGSSAFWVGTIINRKSFLYRALCGDDPRFACWNRKILRARFEDENGVRHVLWPAKWPWHVLEAKKEEIGPSAYASEYDNAPISDKERVLIVDERKNEYEVEGEFDWSNPLGNHNKIKWCDRIFEASEDGGRLYFEEKEGKYSEVVAPMYKFLLFDYASGLTSTSDYSCIAVCGMDTQLTLWVLAMWMGRANHDSLMRMIYGMGLAWRVRVVGIEAIGLQKDFVEAYQAYADEQNRSRNDSWIGRVFPIRYPAGESKGDRIAALEWRFNAGRIKYPRHLEHVWPYTELYAETADFTRDLALLTHDDAIDTISMSKYVVKTRGGKPTRERSDLSLLERVIKNKPPVPGVPLLSGVSTSMISDDITNILSQRARAQTKPLGRHRRERPRQPNRRRS